MNLKEAFRFQNKLQFLMNEAEAFLLDDSNVLSVQITYLRKKVMPEAEDETVLREKASEYGRQVNEMMAFYMYLLEQKQALSGAIRAAKAALPIDMDSEFSLNAGRQRAAQVFARLASLRASETVSAGGGTGYRFNAEGNQVTYRCDARKVTTIDFDRNVARKYLAALNRKADEMSAQLDKAMVNSQVDFAEPFDVNTSFADAFEAFCAAGG